MKMKKTKNKTKLNIQLIRKNEHEVYLQRLKDLKEKQETELGPDHPELAETLSSLADYAETKKEAEELIQKALNIREQVFGSFHCKTAESLHDLAYIKAAQKQYPDAEKLVQRSMAIYEKVLGQKSRKFNRSLELLANILALQGSLNEAEKLMRQSVASLEQANGSKSWEAAEGLWRLAKFFVNTKQYSEAEKAHLDLLARAETIDDNVVSALEKADYYESYMYLLRKMRRTQDAEKIKQKVKEIWANEGEPREDL